jgi:benzodiazapine receptor
LKIANGTSFVIAMIVNATSNMFSKATQPEIVAEWDIKLSPSGWAFSIWGIIYTLLAGFTVY